MVTVDQEFQVTPDTAASVGIQDQVVTVVTQESPDSADTQEVVCQGIQDIPV